MRNWRVSRVSPAEAGMLTDRFWSAWTTSDSFPITSSLCADACVTVRFASTSNRNSPPPSKEASAVVRSAWPARRFGLSAAHRMANVSGDGAV
eukprot:1790102-Rhodomonas_salina.7